MIGCKRVVLVPELFQSSRALCWANSVLLGISTDVNAENDGFMLAVMSCSISQLVKSFHFQPGCFVSLSAKTKQSAALKMKLKLPALQIHKW